MHWKLIMRAVLVPIERSVSTLIHMTDDALPVPVKTWQKDVDFLADDKFGALALRRYHDLGWNDDDLRNTHLGVYNYLLFTDLLPPADEVKDYIKQRLGV